MVLKKDQAKNSKKKTILISHFQESLNTVVFFICKVHYLKFKKTSGLQTYMQYKLQTQVPGLLLSC